jgi:hypothetical protein
MREFLMAGLPIRARPSEHQPPSHRAPGDQAEIAFADLSDKGAFAEGLPKYTFAALLKERQNDLAFFDECIEKGLVAKLAV